MSRQPKVVATAAILCLVFITQGQGQALGQGRGRGPAALPDGPGKEQVQTTCSKCHATTLVTNAGGNTRQEWIDLFSTMVSLPKDQSDTIAGYLAKNFPPQPRPQPVVIPGPFMVSFKEWNAPTLGSRPHDPEPGPSGTIWWTGMFANVLGRVDPKTGDIKEYPLKTPMSGPHGLEFDKDGVVYGELEGLYRKARSQDGRCHGIQAA